MANSYATDREYLRRAEKASIGSEADVGDAEDAANKKNQRHLTFFKDTDAATSTARNIPLLWTSHKIRIISVSLVPCGSTSSGSTNATNFSTISLEYDDGAGGSDTQVGVFRTNTTALADLTKVALTLTAANTEVASGKNLMLKTAKSGAGGEQLNAFLVDVCYQEI